MPQFANSIGYAQHTYKQIQIYTQQNRPTRRGHRLLKQNFCLPLMSTKSLSIIQQNTHGKNGPTSTHTIYTIQCSIYFSINVHGRFVITINGFSVRHAPIKNLHLNSIHILNSYTFFYCSSISVNKIKFDYCCQLSSYFMHLIQYLSRKTKNNNVEQNTHTHKKKSENKDLYLLRF